MENREFTKADFNKKYIKNGLEKMPGGYFIYRADYETEEVLYANGETLEIFGCETNEEFLELTGGTFRGMVYADDYKRVEKHIRHHLVEGRGNFTQVNYRIITKNGTVKYVEDFGRYCMDSEEGPLFYVFLADAQTTPDSLTGLPNRWAFLRRGEQNLQDSEEKYHMVALDLRGMKGFNSAYGIDEGDRLLCTFANILRKQFGNENCSRFGEDHFFVLTKAEDVEGHLNAIMDEFEEANHGRSLSVKMGVTVCEGEKDLEESCDRARLACIQQKGSYSSGYSFYEQQMIEDYEKSEYILAHFNEALEKEYIELYLQPIIRTLSGKVACAEALSRWNDPIKGVIMPGDYVPVLEENGLSYKLDRYMIKKVAALLKEEIKDGQKMCPVSVNISRSDFEYMDPVKVVIDAMDANGLKHNMICVEITESALITDTGRIKDAIERFHLSGISAGMDDFGSGYSSLNVLKDFDFDEVKIDMLFMRDFNEKSRIVVKKTVQMAKELGMHTLAEGVETEEQLEFLKGIGCEKIQGYYYAKPLPAKEQMERMKELGYEAETRDTAAVLDMTGLINLATNKPRALFFFDGENFQVLFENDYYKNTMAMAGIGGREEKEGEVRVKDMILSNKFKSLALRAKESKKEEIMTFYCNERYFHFSFKEVAEAKNGSMLMATVDGTEYDEQKYVKSIDAVLGNVLTVFECIYVIDLDKNTRTVLITNLPSEEEGQVNENIKEFYSEENYHTRVVYPEDRARWREFTKRDHYRKRFMEKKGGSFTEVFRMKNQEGNYEWKAFIVIGTPESDGHRIVVCVKNATMPAEITQYEAEKNHGRIVESSYAKLLLDTVMDYSGLRFFWKDHNRRFIGVSTAFLDFYGFESEDVILGKTDEEVGWHLDDEPYRNDELRVLNKGAFVRNSLGTNVVGGVVRNISATKFPIYENGKIIGLMGYFIDLDNDINNVDILSKGSFIDAVTGLMNVTGQMNSMIRLDDILRTNGEDYAYVDVEVPEYQKILEENGKEVAEEYIRHVAKCIQKSFGQGASIARETGCVFGILIRNADLNTIPDSEKKCVEEINEIKTINGRKCRGKACLGVSYGSEAEDTTQVIKLARSRARGIGDDGIDSMENKVKIESGDNLTVPYIIVRPEFDQETGVVKDFRYLYVNDRYCELAGVERESLIGKSYLQKFPQGSKKWVDYAYRASRGEFIQGKGYGIVMQKWVNFIAAPAVGGGTSSILFIEMEGEMEE
ncbi:MAG: EAL domain-containing protein [Lachnospiraceae bacterium]|nr:EAL domain-containing protein [Lachnospiraceae bacterium]